MKHRVVITGMGIWSCIGQDLASVSTSLQQGRSGIIFDPKRLEYGLHSGLAGNVPQTHVKDYLPRKFRATMSEDAEYAFMAARQAFSESGIDDYYLNKNEVGIIWGNDGNSHILETHEVMKTEHNSLMVGPYAIFRTTTSSAAINLSAIFHLRGINMSIAAACASSSHAIGIASLYIQNGLADVILSGGSCELSYTGALTVDAVRAVSLRNDCPTKASRPFDKGHDGMVPSGGGAALVLEEYEHAKARGAKILAEVVGYGFSNNGGREMAMASRDAEYTAMIRALRSANLGIDEIDYINAHATSTPHGDIEEAAALRMLLEGRQIPISSTKSMTGHENWMAGASEAIYSILMMQNSFVAPNINLVDKIDEAKDLNIVTHTINMPINAVLSNSLGMGGTNSALVFIKA